MSEVASLLEGELFNRVIDRGAAKVADHGKQKEIVRLIREMATRAAMMRTSVDLSIRFKNVHLVEELLAHRKLMDKTRDEIIKTFLGEEADEETTKFVGKFCDRVNEIMAAADSWFSHLAVEVAGENTSNEWCEPVDPVPLGRRF